MKKPKPNYLDIVGTPNDDFLVGTDFGDRIEGLGGNDILIGGHGLDSLFGGPGDDVYRVEESQDQVAENVGEGFDRVYCSGDYALLAGQEIELLSFIAPDQDRDLNLTGNEFAQTIIGSAGDNGFTGGLGNDVMVGLGGNDAYQIQDLGDVILEEAGGGDDTALVHNALGSYTLQAGLHVERLYAFSPLSTVALNLTGNEFANNISGSAGANVLIGGGGNDNLEGLRGSDTYRIDDMGDIVLEVSGGANDVDQVYVAMNLSGYTLNDQAHVEVLSPIDPSSTMAFNLNGNSNHNTIFGTAVVNVLIGGGGWDTLAGGAGNDVYRVEEANDNVIEGAGGGYDAVYAVTSYTLTAGQEIELLSAIEPGATGAMNLTGNAAANEIYGNDGANVIDGKAGDDLLFGRGGADTFAFTLSPDMGNVDTIADFLAGTDKIGLDDAAFGTSIGTPGAFNANAFRAGTAAADGDDRIIYDQATGRLFYDADGNGAGAAYHFATLAGTPVLGASDFSVI